MSIPDPRLTRHEAHFEEKSRTHGMNLGERIAHVGGRTNADGYIEFGSVMAVSALIQHFVRDLVAPGAASDIHALIKDATVSVDVSTGEDDAFNRLYGKVYGVEGTGKDMTILVCDTEPNFDTPVKKGEPLYECANCGCLYQTKVTRCDCMPDKQEFRNWTAYLNTEAPNERP